LPDHQFLPTADSRLFHFLPKPIRRTYATQAVGYFLADDTSLNNLVSRQHVVVYLELLGQAFALDVEDEAIIKQVTELYKQWILSDKRPGPMKEDEQYFWVVRLAILRFMFDMKLKPFFGPAGNVYAYFAIVHT